MVRWGEKVPLTVGTVCQGLGQRQGSAAYLQGSGFPAQRAESPAVGARLLFAEGQGLLLQEGLEGVFGEASSGGGSELLHGGEIDVESGALVAEGPSGDNCAPLGGEITDVAEVLGRKFAACHRQSCLRVAENGETACP